MKTAKQIRADKVNEAIASLAVDLKPIVDSIESSIATTQNHYGNYLQLLTTFCKGSTDPMLQIVTSALLDCGANPDGMASAYKIYKG